MKARCNLAVLRLIQRAFNMLVRFGPDEYELKTSWGASREFLKLIGDPLDFAFRAYNGERVWDAETCVRAIWIGQKHAGGKLTFDEVGELCQKHGIVNYMAVANDFLIELVSGGQDTEKESEKKAQAASE